ncbi:unnamed protein product [Heligmosomoides polygyrus]|uniref:Plus3 domain-containing protein n=1 Tax=Heligmosomoides polygyrus TaxID=6339 RepID=A0A183GNA2_HELPZ|nr:unnamed protein product [Heligmosomoides polygyrus]
MVERPGFEHENVNQEERIAENQEHINRRVLSEYIRVINCPNPDRLPLKELVTFFLNNVAKMSYGFWEYFTTDGRKRLMEYNRQNKSQIRVIRDQTLSLTDVENLSLYLRVKIRNYCTEKDLPTPEISVKNGYIVVGDILRNGKRYRSTELAVLLGWDYSDWHGAAISKLMSNTERKNMSEGKIVWGSLAIEKLLPRRHTKSAMEAIENDDESEVQIQSSNSTLGSRKRASPTNQEGNSVDIKKSRS